MSYGGNVYDSLVEEANWENEADKQMKVRDKKAYPTGINGKGNKMEETQMGGQSWEVQVLIQQQTLAATSNKNQTPKDSCQSSKTEKEIFNTVYVLIEQKKWKFKYSVLIAFKIALSGAKVRLLTGSFHTVKVNSKINK